MVPILYTGAPASAAYNGAITGRHFLSSVGWVLLGLAGRGLASANSRKGSDEGVNKTRAIVNLFLGGDIVVASIHWGGNWGYSVPEKQRQLARRLIEAGVDVAHGHSSHHAKGIEVINGRPVIYGCGDLINDYEGIRGHNDHYRGELPLLYFVSLDAANGGLVQLQMVPMRIRKFRLQHASAEEAKWMRKTLHREGQSFNTTVGITADQVLDFGWA